MIKESIFAGNLKKMKDSIFISYAREDIASANELYDFLKSKGFAPWMDKKNLRAGEKWDAAIMTALKKADYIILLLSTMSLGKRGYIQREFKLALEYCKEKLKTDIYLIPCKIDDCEIPQELSEFQWVDLREPDAFNP